LLSHAPINKNSEGKFIPKEGQFTQSGGGGEEFSDRAESQLELIKLMDVCFEKKAKLGFEEFKKVSEDVTSEMFFCLFTLVKTKFPSLATFKRYEQGLKKSSESLLLSPSIGKRMAPPKVLSKFSGMSQLVKFSTPKVESHTVRIKKAEDDENPEESKGTTAQRPYLSKLSGKPKSTFAPGGNAPASPVSSAVRLPNQKLKSKEVINSPSVFLGGQKTDKLLFCECGKEITDYDKLLCAECVNKLKQPKCESYLLKKSKKELKKFWACIEKKELYSNYIYIYKC
jgi:hypothetical protein